MCISWLPGASEGASKSILPSGHRADIARASQKAIALVRLHSSLIKRLAGLKDGPMTVSFPFGMIAYKEY